MPNTEIRAYQMKYEPDHPCMPWAGNLVLAGEGNRVLKIKDWCNSPLIEQFTENDKEIFLMRSLNSAESHIDPFHAGDRFTVFKGDREYNGISHQVVEAKLFSMADFLDKISDTYKAIVDYEKKVKDKKEIWFSVPSHLRMSDPVDAAIAATLPDYFQKGMDFENPRKKNRSDPYFNHYAKMIQHAVFDEGRTCQEWINDCYKPPKTLEEVLF
jgi:hypothetical protein